MSQWAEDRSMPVPESGCWIWTGCADSKGYGMATLRGKTSRAHRISWQERFGAIPPGVQVLHKCDTPSCVNPAHLFLGTNSDNVADKVSKNRQARGAKIGDAMCGENQGHSKLTTAIVAEIKRSESKGVELAKKYGVSQSVISEIRSGKLWRRA